MPEYKQFFGSTSSRGAVGAKNPYVRDRAHEMSHLGPGAYQETRTAIQTKRSIFQTSHGAFASTGSRFKEDAKSELPGPGAYGLADPNSLAKAVAAKAAVRSSQASFGSTSSRFAGSRRNGAGGGGGGSGGGGGGRPAKSAEPGPGDFYNPELFSMGDKNPASRGKISSAFRSSGRSFNPAAKETAPPPGAYDPAKEKLDKKEVWMQSNTRGAFGSTGGRFASNRALKEASELPGPGHFADNIVTPRAPPARTHTLRDTFGTSKRFDSEKRKVRTSGPGPGYYDAVDPYSSLNKRSFNITVNEDDASSIFVR